MIGQTRFVRRIFVVCAYAIFVCLLVRRAGSGSHFAFKDLGFVFLLFLLMVNHRRIADRVRRKQRPYVPNPDEYDVAVRDRASYVALNIVAWCVLVLCMVSGVVFPFPSIYRFSPSLIMEYGLFSLLVIAFTLPSAIILWIEPDLAEKERELRPRMPGAV
jgi:hypothetical protein